MKLCVVLLLLLLQTCSVSTYQNVAMRGKATQSNRYEFGFASNAIDGNRDNHFFSGSCSHTDKESNPWWRVDLLEPYVVTSVIISNRGDCCSERLWGHRSTSATLLSTMGRYVTVHIPGEGKVVALCEVEVYGYHAPTEENLAIQGKAAQSSVYQTADASKAIDGNRASNWITNRYGVHERLDGAEIRIGDSLVNNGAENPRFAVITSIPAGETAEFKVPNGMDGRYVYIGVPGRKEYLTLCEVEVFGSALD
ncbi:hypothetical protein KUCAC02_014321 [Chaenocephalus aceratus]|uniref:Uncharacterized protein n=1 Tax=Chaenocephalus aceratus TaxID=36190 RepID=A0ACB9WEB0_CHAAC|nr:hypothetical protein KUCAC02_014321 [Chaenocephalus aceratus]